MDDRYVSGQKLEGFLLSWMGDSWMIDIKQQKRNWLI
jgi:hypothetical protein